MIGRTGVPASQIDKEFARFVTNQRATDPNFDRAAAIKAGVPSSLVNSLATRTAVDLEVKKLGLQMTDEMVQEFLQSSEQFKNPRTGKFDSEALTSILQTYNYQPQEFRDQIGDDLRREQLTSALSSGAPAPRPLIEVMLLREFERRTVSYLTITDELAGQAKEPTQKALEDYYAARSGDFMAPEYRTFAVVPLKTEQFVDRSLVSEEAVRKLYDAQKARYAQPEKRTLYQTRFDTEGAAKAAADRLKAGVPFEAIAQEAGAELAALTQTDVTKRDIVDPGVADATFAEGLAAGAVVGPVKGVFGYTVAQIVDIHPATTKPLEEVRAAIETEMLAQDSRRRLFEAVEAIESERDTGASLEDAARKAGLAIERFGPVDSYSFGKGGEIVGGVSGEVLQTAFSLEDGDESEATEFADKSGYYFVSLTDIAASARMPFAEVRGEVEQKWRESEREGRLNATVKKVRDTLTAKKSLAEAAAPLNRAPVSVTLTRQGNSEAFSAEVVDQLFAVGKGEAVSGPVGIGSGQVVAVVDDIAFDASEVTPQTFDAFVQYVGNQLDQELFSAYASTVREDYGVKIDQKQIDALFGEAQ
jgi:peptidyl-prolyl cis-trans isomerase D